MRPLELRAYAFKLRQAADWMSERVWPADASKKRPNAGTAGRGLVLLGVALLYLAACNGVRPNAMPRWLGESLRLSEPEAARSEEQPRDGQGMPPKSDGRSVIVHNNRHGKSEVGTIANPSGVLGNAANEEGASIDASDPLRLREPSDPALLGLPRLEDARVRVEKLLKEGKNEVLEFVFVSNASPEELAAMYQESLRSEGLEVQELRHRAGETKSVHLFGRNPEMRYTADFERIDDLHATRASMRFQKQRELSDEEFLGIDNFGE